MSASFCNQVCAKRHYSALSMNRIQSQRHWFLHTALQYLGTPYIWGGDDPSGFDCSGFVIECLKSVGLFPAHQDCTADQLYRRFCDPDNEVEPSAGNLIFHLDRLGRASHVSICLDQYHLISASGGGPVQDDPFKSWRDNAFVKIRPLLSTSDRYSLVDPFSKGSGKN